MGRRQYGRMTRLRTRRGVSPSPSEGEGLLRWFWLRRGCLGDGAELLHHAHDVRQCPELRNTPLAERGYAQAVHRNRAAGGWQAHELTEVRAADDDADGNAVVFADGLLDVVSEVREGGVPTDAELYEGLFVEVGLAGELHDVVVVED